MYEYEQRAQELERSNVPTYLKIAQWVVWAVYVIVVVNVILLVTAFVLRLFGASTDAEFTQWVYRSTEFAMRPFRGIFPSHTGENGSVIDFAVLFAIIAYGILAMAFHALVAWLDRKIYEQRYEAWQLSEAAGPPPAPPAA